MTTHKNGNRKPSKEAEALANMIDDLIMARIEHIRNPNVGSEVANKRHEELADELKKVL